MFIKNFNNIIDDIVKKDHHSERKVIQINPLTLYFTIWNSATEAGKNLNINSKCISAVCKGKQTQAYGYYWRYYDEFINEEYIRCDKNNYLDIFNLLPGGNLSNYIEPCFTLLPGEILCNIEEYKIYKISNMGRIVSIESYPYIRELKPQIDVNGYCRIGLNNNSIKNMHSIHRLVANAFIPNSLNLPCINHKDENKLNNRVDNLEWCTVKYNNNYGTRNIRIAKIVEQIDLNTGKVINEFYSATEAERITNINCRHISAVCLGKYKTAGGYGWRFKL